MLVLVFPDLPAMSVAASIQNLKPGGLGELCSSKKIALLPPLVSLLTQAISLWQTNFASYPIVLFDFLAVFLVTNSTGTDFLGLQDLSLFKFMKQEVDVKEFVTKLSTMVYYPVLKTCFEAYKNGSFD